MVLTSYAFQQCVLYPGYLNRKRNTKTQTEEEGRCILLWIYNELMKTDNETPTQLFCTRQVTWSQSICFPTRTSLAKRKGFSRSCEEKQSLVLSDCWGFNIVPLWMIEHCDFPGGLSCPCEHLRFLCTKRPLYIWATAEDIIKMSGHWAAYIDTASTPELINSCRKYLCLMPRKEFLQIHDICIHQNIHFMSYSSSISSYNSINFK